MILRFWWQERFDELEPECETDTHYCGGTSLLSRLLRDSGGLHYLKTIPSLEYGLTRVATAKQGEAESVDWDREDWGAHLSQAGATIYSLYDEQYVETIDLDAFEKALRAWIEFIQTPPDAKAAKTIEI